MRRFPALCIGFSSLAFIGAASAAAAVGHNQMEISTAAEHAEHAYQGKAVKEIHSHLHHVINCLVGPGGQGFDKTNEDPCDGQGNGAINDVDANSDQQHKLQQALQDANNGLQKNDYKSAHDDAKKVLDDLTKAQETTQGPGPTG